MPDDKYIPPIPDLGNDEQAYILTGAERHAIRDARLIVHLVRGGQLEQAHELATMTEGHFLDELEALADRIEHGDRVAMRKIGDWIAQLKEHGHGDES